MTRILYEDKGDGSNVTLEFSGNGIDLLKGVTHIVASAGREITGDTDKLLRVLPALVALENAALDKVEKIDLSAIRQAMERGHE